MKKNLFLTLCSSTLLAVLLAGCSEPFSNLGVVSDKDNSIKILSKADLAQETLSYDVLSKTALSSCLNCHSSGSTNLSTAANLAENGDDVLSEIQSGAMPPRSSGFKQLDACEKQMLEYWLDDQSHSRVSTVKVGDLPQCASYSGAPAQPAPVDFAKLPLSYTNLRDDILAKHCMSCHTTDNPRSKILFDTLDEVQKEGLLGTSSADSKLFAIVTATTKFMPPAKSGLPRLNEAEVDYLKRWLDGGAKP